MYNSVKIWFVVILALIVGLSSCKESDENNEKNLGKVILVKPAIYSSKLPADSCVVCWSWEYLTNYLNDEQDVGDVSGMEDWLTSRGWQQIHQISATHLPQAGDIILFSSGYHGVRNPMGHAAIVKKAEMINSKLHVIVQGANQDNGGKRQTWEEKHCSNVSLWDIKNLETKGVSIWRK